MADSRLEKQAKYIEAREMGMYPVQAARYAGYKDATASAKRLETENPAVMEAIVAVEERNRQTTEYTREKVLAGIADAINIAKLAADPMGMLRGYAEINRMCGFYEPEKKEVLVTTQTVSQRKRAIAEASTDKLLELVAGSVLIEDAEYEVVDEVS